MFHISTARVLHIRAPKMNLPKKSPGLPKTLRVSWFQTTKKVTLALRLANLLTVVIPITTLFFVLLLLSLLRQKSLISTIITCLLCHQTAVTTLPIPILKSKACLQNVLPTATRMILFASILLLAIRCKAHQVRIKTKTRIRTRTRIKIKTKITQIQIQTQNLNQTVTRRGSIWQI